MDMKKQGPRGSRPPHKYKRASTPQFKRYLGDNVGLTNWAVAHSKTQGADRPSRP